MVVAAGEYRTSTGGGGGEYRRAGRWRGASLRRAFSKGEDHELRHVRRLPRRLSPGGGVGAGERAALVAGGAGGYCVGSAAGCRCAAQVERRVVGGVRAVRARAPASGASVRVTPDRITGP